ncbi:MAG: hypothetical protein HYY17_05570 [Planctomycetes bacterium]|nr:hypothetical protein [Planctomycetota bacterium]
MVRMVALAAATLVVGGVLIAATPAQDKAAGGKYMGAQKCKSCHEAKARGAQYVKWTTTKHAKAWEALASDEAKKIVKERGLGDDPQKIDACVKCHQTAFGVKDEDCDKAFDRKGGIQCESCHGPGEKHAKARLADDDEDEAAIHEKAKKEMPLPVKADLCKKCHNAESPSIEKSTYWNKEKKEFDFEKAFKEQIEHPNPKWQKK